MARCHLCKKKLGLGFFSKWVTMDRNRFCLPCAPQYAEQRKLQALKDILDKPSPQPIFTIHQIWTKNPDKPSGRQMLLGATAFLDKGICFIHLGSHTKNDGVAGLVFGIIGAVIADAADHNKMVKELDRISDQSPLTEETLFDRMLGAERVLFYPFCDIKKLSHDRKGFNIHFGKQRKRFAWYGGGKTYQRYKQLLEAYSQAIRTQSDPVALCDRVR